jgi:hypothetical protein
MPIEFGGTSHEPSGALSAEDVLERLRDLVDAEPAEDGYPPDWTVPAYYLGDVNALATLSLRSER